MATYGGPNYNIGETYKDFIQRVNQDNGSIVKPNAPEIQQSLSSGLSQDPSLFLYPIAQKTGSLYTMLPNTGSADFTVSRNGTATYFDKDGLLKIAQANEPRLEFDPVTGEFKGVLVEPAATNLLLRSLYFESSNWLIQGNRISRTFNSGIAPDGTLTATKFTRVIDGTYLLRQVLPSSPFTLGSTWTYSVWVKAINQNITVNLDISDRGNTSFSVTPQEGWKRISATHTWNDTHFNTVGHFFDIAVVGLSLDNSHLLWGAQLEVGSVATSYIPTVASTVTRPADIIQRTNAQDLIGQTEGSVYLDFFYPSNIESGYELFNIQNVVNSYLIRSRINKTGLNKFDTIYSGNEGPVPLHDSFTLTSGAYNKIALVYNHLTNTTKVFHNGSFVAQTIGSQPYPTTSQSTIGVGNWYGAVNKTSFRNLALFKTSLTDEQAITLTTL